MRLAAVTSPSKTFGSKWCGSVAVARGFFDCKIPQRNDICYSPERSKIVSKLVRIDLNLTEGMHEAQMIRNLLRMELEPFIVGVGQVTAEDTPEGTLSRSGRLPREYPRPYRHLRRHWCENKAFIVRDQRSCCKLK